MLGKNLEMELMFEIETIFKNIFLTCLSFRLEQFFIFPMFTAQNKGLYYTDEYFVHLSLAPKP